MPRKDGFLLEIIEKSTIKAENRKNRKNAAISQKLTANVKEWRFQQASYNSAEPLAVTLLRLLLKTEIM